MLIANWQLLDAGRSADPEPLRQEWRDLAARALLPAGLNAPEFMLPLFRHLGGAELATVYAGTDLVLALPVRHRSSPPAVLTNWVTPLSVSGLPHVDRTLGAAALGAFLRHARAPVLLTGIPADGPFRDALRDAAPRHAILEQWQRAALRPTGTFDTWFEASFERKRRKEFRRLRARLSETGRLESASLQPGEDVRPWVDALTTLEAMGWKGRRGTALKGSPKLADALAEICHALHAAGNLRFWALRLDGRTIATLFAVVESSQAWLGKIAYDESLAKYSPGVLLILDATAAFFAEPGITLVDSLAIPNHPMIDHLWRDRVAMADVLVAAEPVSKARFALLLAAEKLRRRARSLARDAYHKLTRRHRS